MNKRLPLLLPLLLLLCLGILAAMATGCVKNSEPTERPATQVRKENFNTVYALSSLKIKAYNGYIIDPVGFINKGDDPYEEIPLEEMSQLDVSFTNSLTKALKSNGIAIRTKPGKNIGRIQLMVFDLRPTEIAVLGEVYKTPIGNIDLKNISLDNEASFAGSVSYSIQVIDSLTGELLLGAMQQSSASSLDPRHVADRWFSVKQSIDNAARSLGAGLSKRK